MQLHQRGVDLLVNVLDAADHIERLRKEEIRDLLKEIAEVMSQILERDAVVALQNGRSHSAWTNELGNVTPLHPTQIEIPASGGEPGNAEQP